jgi:excinuclease ABC subunit A
VKKIAGKNSPLTSKQKTIAERVIKEISERLTFLVNVGLDYLTLNRSATTLSGGEAQRIRLATQVGSRLVGVLYVLDEPSIGLHPRDNSRLLDTLKGLRDLGNTVLIVEHDDETIREADWVIDLGPAAGESRPPIRVLVKNARVKLTGSVPTSQDRARAEEVIRGVNGVLSVDNRLSVAETLR